MKKGSALWLKFEASVVGVIDSVVDLDEPIKTT